MSSLLIMCLLSAVSSVHVDLFARNVSSSDHHFVISNLVATGRPNYIIIPSHGSTISYSKHTSLDASFTSPTFPLSLSPLSFPSLTSLTGDVKLLTKGDSNPVDDRSLYAEGQLWVSRDEISGRARG